MGSDAAGRAAARIGDGGAAQRRQQRPQSNLRPRDRSGEQAEAAAAKRTADHRAGLAFHHGHLCAGAGARLAGGADTGATNASGWWRLPSSAPTSIRCRRCGPSGSASGRNVTIAIPRGVLLKVAGWSSVKTIVGLEPWYIGAIFGLFLLGATTTKDFADMEGDRRGGCRTLPIQYGVRRAAWMISPSFVVPFVMIGAAPRCTC